MILLDAPYVSDLLKTTIRDYDLPVVATRGKANKSKKKAAVEI